MFNHINNVLWSIVSVGGDRHPSYAWLNNFSEYMIPVIPFVFE